MEKLKFDSDYMEGCYPAILERLQKINLEKNTGYGLDEICDSAKDKIRACIGNKDADVYFLVGGTQTNSTVIDALLKSYQGVLACDTGHIEVHEAGAIEAFGHKVVTLKNTDGRLMAKDVKEYLDNYYGDESHEHVVPVGAVYISQPTESGTIYTKEELEELYATCQEYHQYLYIDGARLGYCLAAEPALSLEIIAKNCDAFYIGGTKVGAMFGEAVVFKNKELSKDFFTIIKRHGALLAKGWMLGVQFDTLFTDNTYLEISKNAITMANRLEEGLLKKGYKMANVSKTNQRFVLIDEETLERISKKVSFNIWEKTKEGIVIRFVTSWATTSQQIDELLSVL